MPPLPRRLVAYIWFVSLLAVAAAIPAFARFEAPSGAGEWVALLLIPPMLAAALHYPLHLTAKTQHDTTATPAIVAVVLLPAPMAILAVLLGTFIGEMRKSTRRTAQVAFNTSVAALSVAVASALAGPIHGAADHGAILAAGAAALAYWGIGAIAQEFIIALQLGQRPFKEWRRRNAQAIRHEWSLLVIGVLVALLAEHEPWALLLLPMPVSVVYGSFSYQEQRVRQAEAERAAAESERARLTAIVEATPDVVATADTAGRLLYLNEAGRAALGISAAQGLGHVSLAEVFGDWHAASALATGEGAWTGESEIRVPGRDEIPVSQVVLAHRSGTAVEFLSTIARDITAQKELERRLVRLADHDDLTGLLNRRSFDDALARVLRSPSQRGALLFADLDGFKKVNDRFGHSVGDDLLVGVGAIIRASLGDAASAVARLGGDEFAALLPGVDATIAEGVAARLARDVSAFAIEAGEGARASVGVSIGIAAFPADGASASELLARADAAMYEAKQSRKGVALFRAA